VIASLHVRHTPVRQSGAVLGTIAGTSVATLGLVGTADGHLLIATVFVAGVWWWTIGKMWAETGVLSRVFGWITMALAVACFALVALFAATGIPMSPPDLPLRMLLGAWLFALAALLYRDALRSRS
jgi:hypothetical protein